MRIQKASRRRKWGSLWQKTSVWIINEKVWSIQTSEETDYLYEHTNNLIIMKFEVLAAVVMKNEVL